MIPYGTYPNIDQIIMERVKYITTGFYIAFAASIVVIIALLFIIKKTNWKPQAKGLLIFNLCFCIVGSALAFKNINQVTVKPETIQYEILECLNSNQYEERIEKHTFKKRKSGTSYETVHYSDVELQNMLTNEKRTETIKDQISVGDIVLEVQHNGYNTHIVCKQGSNKADIIKEGIK